jgi:hypothetical protein
MRDSRFAWKAAVFPSAIQWRQHDADTSYIEGILIILSVVVGAVVGRWWALGIAVPIGLWFALEFDAIENSSPPHWDLGAIVTLVVAAAIAAGVLIRRYLRRAGIRQ